MILRDTVLQFSRLFSKKSTLKGDFASYLIKVHINNEILTKILFLSFLQTSNIQYYIISLSERAAGQSGVNKRALQQYPIDLPPLSEQKRIVKILVEAFAAIDQAKANAEKNLQNSRELFDAYLNKVFANPGDGWEEKKIGEITTKIGSGATPRGGNKSYKTEGVALIRSLNVYDREFRKEKLAFINDEQAQKLSNVTLIEDDVLLNITGASIARCCIVLSEYLPARVNQHVSIIRIVSKTILPKFLNYLLTSKVYKDKLLQTGEKGGATRQALTKSQIENFSILYPPSISEQQKIVSKLEDLSLESQKLEAIYQQKLANLEELKKSILQKAFNGQLKSDN
ncbi:MAG: restriction endonuclease subunit S [Calditrichae bacterium]|nr:restriction endonuclease subunit S [Calditrichia bacterium]